MLEGIQVMDQDEMHSRGAGGSSCVPDEQVVDVNSCPGSSDGVLAAAGWDDASILAALGDSPFRNPAYSSDPKLVSTPAASAHEDSRRRDRTPSQATPQSSRRQSKRRDQGPSAHLDVALSRLSFDDPFLDANAIKVIDAYM